MGAEGLVMSVKVPRFWENAVKKAMQLEGWVSYSAYLRELIRQDLKRKGLLGKSVLEEVSNQ